MFEINNQYIIKTSLPVIAENYTILHFDEYPILFTGINKYKNKILGSLSCEDDDIFRYFIIIIDDKQYTAFINSKKSYLDLLKEVVDIFIVDKDINDKLLLTYQVPLEEIPNDYLPYPDSFIPVKKLSNSLNFGFSLKGKLADFHKALVEDVNSVNQRIYSYLEESLAVLSLNTLSLSPLIYSQPSEKSSYRLNFDIEFRPHQSLELFPINQNKIKEFLNSYLNYIAYIFPDEEDDILSSSPDKSKNIQLLKHKLLEIYDSGNIVPNSTIDDMLIGCISNTASKLTDVTEYLKVNESFDSVEIGNYSESGTFSSIGLITDDYKSSVETKLLIDDSIFMLDANNIQADETPKEYRILVYQLNSHTGKGLARLYTDQENYDKVRLNIERDGKELTNSIFTKSLDEDKVVDVKGIGTTINGIYKKLDCYL